MSGVRVPPPALLRGPVTVGPGGRRSGRPAGRPADIAGLLACVARTRGRERRVATIAAGRCAPLGQSRGAGSRHGRWLSFRAAYRGDMAVELLIRFSDCRPIADLRPAHGGRPRRRRARGGRWMSAPLRWLPQLAAVLLAGTGCGGSAVQPPPLPPAHALPASPSSHVVVLVMENKERGDVVGPRESRYVNTLARRYAIATASFAVTHPSLPNYLALTSGSTQGITSDCTDCHAAGRNIVDQLEAAHLTWKAYMEGLPRPCSNLAGAGRYANKHDPFMYYDDVARNPRRCRRIVGFDQLDGRPAQRRAADLRLRLARPLPRHARLRRGDRRPLPRPPCPPTAARARPARLPRLDVGRGQLGRRLLHGSPWRPDRDDRRRSRARRRAHSVRPVDHYGVLGTVERALGLPPLGGAAQSRSGTLDPLLAHPRLR